MKQGIALKQALREIEWQDLARMRPSDGLAECMLPLPWLLASWYCAARGWWPLALAASFLFFLVALRLNHEAIHHNLGFGRVGITTSCTRSVSS